MVLVSLSKNSMDKMLTTCWDYFRKVEICYTLQDLQIICDTESTLWMWNLEYLFKEGYTFTRDCSKFLLKTYAGSNFLETLLQIILGAVLIQFVSKLLKTLQFFEQWCRLHVSSRFIAKRCICLPTGMLFNAVSERYGFISEIYRIMCKNSLSDITHNYLCTGLFPS